MIPKQVSTVDQQAAHETRFLNCVHCTTVQNIAHLSYSFRRTTSIIGAVARKTTPKSYKY